MSDARRRMAAEALSVVGYHGDTAEHQELLGAPGHWPLHRPYGRGGISTCAMVALGLLRRIGVQLGPYRVASGLGDAIVLARQRGAWVPAARGRGPGVGDVIQLLGPMHVAVVIGWRRADRTGALSCVTVDGGQVDPLDGLQCVAIRDRRWTDGARPRLGHRTVDGWIDLERLVGACDSQDLR